MEYNVRINLFGTAAVLAVGIGLSILASTWIAVRTVDNRAKAQAKAAQNISVRGSAKQRVRSDIAVWEMAVSSDASDLKSAFLSNEAGAAVVLSYLRDQGFADSEVFGHAISTRPKQRTNKDGSTDVVGYILERKITVTSGKVDLVARAAGSVTELLRDGIQISSELPDYTYSRLAELRVQLLGEASKDARTRADEVVRNTGGRIGIVRNVDVNPIQITAPNSTDFSGGGRYDTSTIEKDATAVVHISFNIET